MTDSKPRKVYVGKANNIYPRKYIYIYLLPGFIILTIAALFPFIYNIYHSMTNKRLFGGQATVFVGLQNFIDIFKDSGFWHSVWVSLIFCVFAVGGEMLIGFILAYLFQYDFKGKRFLRTLIILPMVTTPVAAAYMFRLMLNPDFGIVNYFIGIVAGGLHPLWLSSMTLALPTLIIIDIWRATPFAFLVLCSGISSLPKDEFEAAKVDGANKLQVIWYIMLPLLKPIIVTILLFRMVDSFKVFDTIIALTAGGPGNATETLNLAIYRTAFSAGYIGSAGALSIVMSIIILIMCVSLLRFVKIGMLED